MNPIDVRIRKFIAQNQSLTLATQTSGHPYCCSLFYAFDEREGVFYFMSSVDSRHAKEIILNPNIAGTVLNGEESILNLQGIQFLGTAHLLEGEDYSAAKKIYVQRHPTARLHQSELWAIKVEWIKMTDNTLGFGSKLIWERQHNVAQVAS